MHSIFFRLWQYCFSYHQWHFSPRNCALCISSEYRKDHFCQKPKGMKRNPFLSRGAESYENHLVFYFWTDFHIHGHLREVRLLRPTSSHGEGQTVTGTQTQASILSNTHATHSPPWHHQDSCKEGEKNCHKVTENKRKFSFTSCLLFFLLLVLQSLQLTAVPQG